MWAMILVHTNNRISHFRERFPNLVHQKANASKYVTTDMVELQAFFGILFLRGAMGSNLSIRNASGTIKVHMMNLQQP